MASTVCRTVWWPPYSTYVNLEIIISKTIKQNKIYITTKYTPPSNQNAFSLDVRAAAYGCADEQTEVQALSAVRRQPQPQHFRECVLMGRRVLLRLLLLGGADPEQTFAHMSRKRISALHHV